MYLLSVCIWRIKYYYYYYYYYYNYYYYYLLLLLHPQNSWVKYEQKGH